MRDIWFDDDESCLACGDWLERASQVPGLCKDCAAENKMDDTSIFEDWEEGNWVEE